MIEYAHEVRQNESKRKTNVRHVELYLLYDQNCLGPCKKRSMDVSAVRGLDSGNQSGAALSGAHGAEKGGNDGASWRTAGYDRCILCASSGTECIAGLCR